MKKVVLISTTPQHYGSAVMPPIASTVDGTNFVKVNNIAVMDEANTVDTPSHVYDEGPPALSHTHLNQVIDNLQNNFVLIESRKIIVEGDKNIANDTRIINAEQSFVFIS